MDFGGILACDRLGNQKWILGWMTRSSFPFPQGHTALAQSHPKKHQDSCIHLQRLHENEAQILWGKNTHQAWKTHTNPTLPNTQGTGVDSRGIPKRENFRLQPQNPHSNLIEWNLWSRDGTAWTRRGSMEIKPGLLGAGSGLILGLEAPLPTPSRFQRVVLLFRGISGIFQIPPSQMPG